MLQRPPKCEGILVNGILLESPGYYGMVGMGPTFFTPCKVFLCTTLLYVIHYKLLGLCTRIFGLGPSPPSEEKMGSRRSSELRINAPKNMDFQRNKSEDIVNLPEIPTKHVFAFFATEDDMGHFLHVQLMYSCNTSARNDMITVTKKRESSHSLVRSSTVYRGSQSKALN